MKLCTVLSCKFHYKTIYIEKINSQNICVCCPIRLRIIDYYWTLESYYIVFMYIDTIVLYFEFCVSENLFAPAWFYLITHWLQKNSCINYSLITICVTKSNSHIKIPIATNCILEKNYELCTERMLRLQEFIYTLEYCLFLIS